MSGIEKNNNKHRFLSKNQALENNRDLENALNKKYIDILLSLYAGARKASVAPDMGLRTDAVPDPV